jgi:hypothetical protein
MEGLRGRHRGRAACDLVVGSLPAVDRSPVELELAALLEEWERGRGGAGAEGGAGSARGGSVGPVLADRLEAHAPGPELTALLASLGCPGLSADELVEAVAAWERIAAWATARQAEAVAELAARAVSRTEAEYTGDWIAARLAITRSAGEGKVALAQTLVDLPALGELLEAGRVDAYKVKVVGDELVTLPLAEQRAVLDTLLEQAPRLTGPQLRQRARKAALAIRPEAVVERHHAAVAERRVELTPAPDGMAWLSAFLPASDAQVCWTALTALAAAAAGSGEADSSAERAGVPGGPGDGWDQDNRRADALTDVLRGILDAGATPGGLPLPSTQRVRPHIQVTLAATTLLGLDEQPGTLAGYGPIPAELARRIAQEGTWRRLLTDPATGQVLERGRVTYRPGADLTGTVIARDVTCRFPGCRVPAAQCDLDHVTPFDPTRSAAEQTTAENLQALCRRHHRLKTHTSWAVARDPATGTTTWTSPTGRTYPREADPPF